MPRWPARLADQVRAHTVFSRCNLGDQKLLIFALEQILGFSLSWFQDSRISQTPNGTQSQSRKRTRIDEIEKQTKSWKADWPFSCWLNTQTNTKVLNLNRTLFKTKHQTNQWKRWFTRLEVCNAFMRVVLKFKVQVLASPKIHKLTINSSMVNNFSRMNCVENQTNDYWENIVQSRRLWITSGGAWWWWCIGIVCTICT